jgi:hypothetical protein
MREADAEKKPYETTDRHGNKITKMLNHYEQTVYMRGMERQMRLQRQMIVMYKAAGLVGDEQATRAKYHACLHEYRNFSTHFKLEPQMWRVYADGLRRV